MKISVNFELEVDLTIFGATTEEVEEEIREGLEAEFDEGNVKNIKITFEE